MTISIYILVWLRTWSQDKGSDHILQSRKVWISVGGVIQVSKVGVRRWFWEAIVTEGGG